MWDVINSLLQRMKQRWDWPNSLFAKKEADRCNITFERKETEICNITFEGKERERENLSERVSFIKASQ